MTTLVDTWIGAAEAARLLGVARPTLYAYVSRGFIRSETTTGAWRERQYSRADVDRMRRRAEERRNPGKVAAHALMWGMPILESSITLIAGDTLYYRGHDAVSLARSRSVAEVASLIWTGAFQVHAHARRSSIAGTPPSVRRLPFIARAQTVLAAASAGDPRAFDLRPDGVAATGTRIIDHLARAASARAPGARTPIDGRLADGWHARRGAADVIRAALILCADHELNVSAFTARCVASSGSNPYAVVIAGLAALEGTRHGGLTVRVESMLQSLRRERHLRPALTERLRRGEPIDGFGHPLYRTGDPRAAALLDLMRARYPRSRELAFAMELSTVAASLVRERPNLDFALATVARVLGLPPRSGLSLFAIGRAIGWIGHAIEQYAVGQIIRPRAKYVGETPAAATHAAD